MKLKQYLNEAKGTKSQIDFIADQLSNDEGSTDAELILHIAKETGISIANISRLVHKERKGFMNGIISNPNATKIIRKYLNKIVEGKFNLGKKGSRAHLIVTDIISWPDWYYNDVPQKSLVNDLMKKFKVDKKKVMYIFDIWHDYRDGKINSMEFQDFTHMVLQGDKYTGY